MPIGPSQPKIEKVGIFIIYNSFDQFMQTLISMLRFCNIIVDSLDAMLKKKCILCNMHIIKVPKVN